MRRMWSDLADQDAKAAAEHLPSTLDEVTRQIESIEAEIGRLRRLITRLEDAALPVEAMSELLAMLEHTEVTLNRFRDELPRPV